MTGGYRTGARILAALADAPMNAEALMHELDITRRGLGIAISYLVKDGRVEQDDRGCYFLAKPDAEPVPSVAKGEPPPIDSSTEEVVPGPPVRDALADIARELTAARTRTSISVGDQVLQLLIAAGRITQDDIRLASSLIGSRRCCAACPRARGRRCS